MNSRDAHCSAPLRCLELPPGVFNMRAHPFWLLSLASLVFVPLGAGAAMITVSPSSQQIAVGEVASVTVSVSDLVNGAAPSLGTFDIDLDFNPAVLSFNGWTFGTGLDVLGLGSLQGSGPVGPGLLNFFEVSLDSVADLNSLQLDAFNLFTVTFNAIAAGTSGLTLHVNALGDAEGLALPADLHNGDVAVAPVPLPGALWLLTSALAAVGGVGLGRRRTRAGAFAAPAVLVFATLASATASAQTACAVTTRIGGIQGNASTQLAGGAHNDLSPLNSQTHTIEGVVVADFQAIPQATRSGELRGFFIEEEIADQDADPTTSEGLFVFTGNSPVLDVREGQRICVRGPVSDFFGMTQITATAAGSLVKTADAALLPAAAELALPVPGDVNDYFEQFEGMRVRFAQPLYVAEYFELARYGQIVLAGGARPFQYSHGDSTPTAVEYSAFLDSLGRNRIILDDGDNVQNSPLPAGVFYHPGPAGFGAGIQGVDFFRGGDTVDGLIGVLHWSFAGLTGTDAWRIRPTQAMPVSFTVRNPRSSAPANVGGNVRVSAFNVLNYFNTMDTTSSSTSGPCGPSGTLDCRGADSAAEFDRQNAKLVQALKAINADAFGLVELENNGNAPTPAIAELVARLNAALPVPAYQYIATGVAGTDAITVGIIYKPAVLQPKGAPALLTAAGYTDPNATGQQRNRPALAQSFQVIGATNPDKGAVFTLVVNHLKSKGADGASGADLDQLDGQSAWNDTRTRAAAYLAGTWLSADPTGQGDPDYLVVGDLNAYRGEAPITVLRNAGYADLHQHFEGAGGYSYVFDGQLGYLDHALANTAMLPQVSGFTTWKINSDEVPVFDYNDTVATTGEASFEAEPTGRLLYEANAYRTSDHDPVVIGLDLVAPRLRGDVDGDGDVDRNDVNAIAAARNQPASGIDDPRDLNGDTVINALDARIDATLCTRAGCATG
jgi:predicted extracellular nuclease